MNHRMTALLLTGVLSLSLVAGCAKNDPTGTTPPPETTPVVTPSQTPDPSDTPALPETPTPDPDSQPSQTPEATPDQKPGNSPSPSPSQKPSQTPEASPTPEGTPDPGQTPDDDVVSQVWEKIASDLADVLPAAMDLTDDDLKTTYGIDAADLESYICKLPMMSASITEFFIAEVKDGKMDTVKAAVQARQEALAGGFLYPSMVELVDDYKLVVNGNYILFCITENADKAVEIFDSYTK